jgi:hypothetical protein
MFLSLKLEFSNQLWELLEEPHEQHSLNIKLDEITWLVSIHE